MNETRENKGKEQLKCNVCGEYHDEENMVQSRFDHNEKVCEQCSEDGN